jgi:TolA-binding protein
MLFTTKKEGAQLRKDVDEIRREIRGQRAALDDQIARAQTEVEKLQKVLAEATQLLERNSADVGAQVQRAQANVDALGGKIEEARHELDALRQELADFRTQTDAKIGELGPKPPEPALPEGKDALWKEAERRFKEKSWDETRRVLRRYLDHYGDDARADDARFMIGETYYAEGRYGAAIGEYQKVIDGFPKGDTVDDAFLRNGQAFFKLKSCGEARVFLQELLRRFPKSPLAPKAKETLDQIDKARKDKSKCGS